MARAAKSVSTRQSGRKPHAPKQKSRNGFDLIQLVIKDESMEPVFYVGERIIVRTNERPLADDYVIARLPNGEHTLRKYRPRRDGGFDLIAEKPKLEAIAGRAADQVELIAVLVEHHRQRGGSLGLRADARKGS